uniref:Uncharacterized protein n=1 Tax=Anguilla anguilla TaxID=7936 RepID=A0A0E9WAC1_ANGAN
MTVILLRNEMHLLVFSEITELQQPFRFSQQGSYLTL